MRSLYNQEENHELTRRETEVVEMICEGLTNKEIGQKLWLSEKTVKNHINSIYRKLEIRHRVDIVIHFYERKMQELKGEIRDAH